VAVILCGCVAALSFWSSRAAPAPRPAERGAKRRQVSPPLSHQKLQVNLDLQAALRESPAPLSRDPFRFYVRAMALTPPVQQAAVSTPSTAEPPLPAAPPGPQMPWKLMAILERDKGRWAVFADCRSVPVPIAEGGSLEGRWRVTAIGAESVTHHSLDDRRIVLPLRGCEPR
jgi:hypothetical protein